MKKKIGIFVAFLAATSAVASAQLSLDIVFDGTTISAATASGGTVEPDGVAVTPDGNTLYLFDSASTSSDGILVWNGTTLTDFALESELTASGNASAGDLTADATNLYTSIFDGTDQVIWRIPHVGGFASAVKMVDDSATVSDNMDEIAVDAKNSRLVISYNDAFEAVTENIVTVPLSASNAAPTVLVTETALEAALATITGYVGDGAAEDDLNISDLLVQSDGDIIVSHGFSSNREINGTLLRVTETGTVSVFRTGNQIITAAGGDASLYDIGSVTLAALPSDQILIVVPFTSNAAVAPFMAIVSADGATQTQVATDAELLALLSAPEQASLVPSSTFFRFDSKATIATDTAGDLYFFRQAGTNSTVLGANAVLKLTGILTADVSDWMAF